MDPHRTHSESLVLSVLGESDVLTIEQLVEKLPELTWSHLFHIIDDLSRRDAIVLRRRGFEYEVCPRREAKESARINAAVT
jgi:hypothetical protein